jgi:hypothetical protein
LGFPTNRFSDLNAASISAYEKFAFRPLVFGNTNTGVRSSIWRCNPTTTRPLCCGNIALKTVTPTRAMTRGRNLRILACRRVRPRTYSSAESESMPGVARGTMLVMPKPQSGSRSSSANVMRSGTRPDSTSSFQNLLEKPAK